jgi:nitrate/TMAO reductase-like tetraheme cytochrome c subunit
MKVISKALGVQCDFCHDMSGMDKDTDNKNKARDMMRMMKTANAKLKKGGFKKSVTCKTCHNGAKEPKN